MVQTSSARVGERGSSVKKLFLMLAIFFVAGASIGAMTTKYKVKGYKPSVPVKADDGTWKTSWTVLRDVETYNEKGEKASSMNADVTFEVSGTEADIRDNAKVKKSVQKQLTPVRTPTPNIIPE